MTPNSESLPAGGSTWWAGSLIGCRYHMSKVAFEIPKAFEIETSTGCALPDDLIDSLVMLAAGNRYESADICTPHLLIVDCDGLPTKEWIDAQQVRINEVLADYYIKHQT